jgi:hypothetical protein
MCLTCHGEKAKIPPAAQATIAREYPDDRATGFSVGDVRGAVGVRIPLVSARLARGLDRPVDPLDHMVERGPESTGPGPTCTAPGL